MDVTHFQCLVRVKDIFFIIIITGLHIITHHYKQFPKMLRDVGMAVPKITETRSIGMAACRKDRAYTAKKEMVILSLLRLSQLQLNDIMSPPTCTE